MRESLIEAYFVKRVASVGGLQRKLQYVGRHGCPDRLLVLNGKVTFVELKATGQRPRAEQEREHARLREAGASVVVIDSMEGVDDLLLQRA